MTVQDVFITELLKQLLPYIVTALAALIVRTASTLWFQFRTAQPDAAEVLYRVAGMAVFAAEQAKLNGWISDKKKFACGWAEAFIAKEYGLRIDVESIGNAVEAAVREMNIMAGESESDHAVGTMSGYETESAG